MKNELIEIVNRQRKIKFIAEDFRGFVESAAGEIPEAAGNSLTVAFVSDVKMRELNRTFRGKNSTTDVLSFPSDQLDWELAIVDLEFAERKKENPKSQIPNPKSIYLGDIVVSLEQAQRQSLENNLKFETEIKQLILHGILHLCGYDHEMDKGEMNGRELELRDKLGIN